MNRKEKQIYALEKSIEHWERLASGTEEPGEEPTDIWCDCCKTFENCDYCPIAEFTGHDQCFHTPYYNAAQAWYLIKSKEDRTSLRINMMNAEVVFLKKVLNELQNKS